MMDEASLKKNTTINFCFDFRHEFGYSGQYLPSCACQLSKPIYGFVLVLKKTTKQVYYLPSIIKSNRCRLGPIERFPDEKESFLMQWTQVPTRNH